MPDKKKKKLELNVSVFIKDTGMICHDFVHLRTWVFVEMFFLCYLIDQSEKLNMYRVQKD